MDIYEFAMQMEQDGERFYRNLAEECSSQGIARVLMGLADDEAKHYCIVRGLAENVESDTAYLVWDRAVAANGLICGVA